MPAPACLFLVLSLLLQTQPMLQLNWPPLIPEPPSFLRPPGSCRGDSFVWDALISLQCLEDRFKGPSSVTPSPSPARSSGSFHLFTRLSPWLGCGYCGVPASPSFSTLEGPADINSLSTLPISGGLGSHQHHTVCSLSQWPVLSPQLDAQNSSGFVMFANILELTLLKCHQRTLLKSN